MPRPRFLRADPALQQAVLDVAAKELAEHGYDGASLNRILLAAGLSKGAFYYYFDDKADLAAAVIERELRRWDIRDLRLGSSADDFWTELERYSWKSVEQLQASPATRDLITRVGAAIQRDSALLERLGPVMSDAQQHLAAVWRRGQELGAVRADISASTLIAVAQATKTALGAAMLPADRGATAAELEAFTRVYLDLLRRIAEPRDKEIQP